MKIEIKNTLKLFAFLVCLLPVWTWAASYEVSTTTSVVDGDTFCGGSACTSADTIIIDGGARGGLKFQDFNGKGSYITITNENKNPNSKVEIDGMSGRGCLSLSNCKYVDLRGNNDGDITYGIKVINDNTSKAAGSVWVYGKSDHIKIGYLEITCEGNTTFSGNGIFVNDANLTNAWTFDTFEIHHNYIHDTRYAGMYLGQNDPSINNKPYVGTFSIHNNLLEDMGTYGITFKGVHADSGVCSIYNNTVKRTGLVSTLSDVYKFGIGFSRFSGTAYANIYNNWIEKTVGAGIQVGDQKHNVYNNIIVGCGTGNDKQLGHGIFTFNAKDVELYDNIIIQAKRYGIYGGYGITSSVSHKRNLIGDSGIGEAGGSYLTEGTGDQANTYESDVSNLNFKTWSDDGDYSNDDFSFSTSIVKAPQNLLLID